MGGPSLEELRLSGCANLTDDAVEHACAHCPKLLKLAISGCSALRLARLSSDSLRVLDCHAVARAVVHHAADRLACPVLHKIVGEGLDDEEAAKPAAQEKAGTERKPEEKEGEKDTKEATKEE